MSKLLTGMDVGKMDLDGRYRDTTDGITEGNAGVRVGAGVDDQPCDPIGARLVDPIDQGALVIGLKGLDGSAVLLAEGDKLAVNLRQRRPTINLRLTGTEKIQIGAVQNEELQHESAYSNASRSWSLSRTSR